MRRPLPMPFVVATAVSVAFGATLGYAQREPERSAVAAPAAQRSGQEPAPETKPVAQRITGNVLDRDGNAVAKVEVRFAGPKKERVWTDARGDFSFTGPSGDYVVTIKQQEFKVRIEDNQLKPPTLIIEPELFN